MLFDIYLIHIGDCAIGHHAPGQIQLTAIPSPRRVGWAVRMAFSHSLKQKSCSTGDCSNSVLLDLLLVSSQTDFIQWL
jgi:hypothetical protein